MLVLYFKTMQKSNRKKITIAFLIELKCINQNVSQRNNAQHITAQALQLLELL